MEEKQKKLKGKMLFKHETEADWLKSSYVPDVGEMVLYDPDDEHQHTRYKFGDGIQRVSDLPFSVERAISAFDNDVGYITLNDLTDFATIEYVDKAMTNVGPSAWDYIITKEEDFTTENLATMSGKVFVDIKTANEKLLFIEVTVPETISLLEFSDNIKFDGSHFVGGKKTTIKNINASVAYPEMDYVTISGFGEVVDCGNKGGSPGAIELYNCNNIKNCTFRRASRCKNISDILVNFEYTTEDPRSIVFNDCLNINNVILNVPDEVPDGAQYDPDTGTMGTNPLIDFKNCKHISNIHSNNSSVKIDYENCLFVDADTCDGYYTDEDDGKIQLISSNGEKQVVSLPSSEDIDLTGYATEKYVDDAIANANKVSGVPVGGKTGQVLKKNSDKDRDVSWQDDVSGQGGTIVSIDGKEVSEFNADTKANVSQLQEDSYYELVLTSENYEGVSQLNQATARTIRVVGLTINEDILLPSVVERIDFVECTTNGAIGHANTFNKNKAELYYIYNTYSGNANGNISGFTLVEGANGYIDITADVVRNCNCRSVYGQYAFNTSAESMYSKVAEKCDAGTFRGCDYVINCYIQAWQFSIGVEDCKSITGMTGETIIFKNCSHIQNVIATDSAQYIDCTYIDFSTCMGAVPSDDVGKVPVLTTDGSFVSKSVYSKDEVDGIVGDIGSVLDVILAKQSSVLGGEA